MNLTNPNKLEQKFQEFARNFRESSDKKPNKFIDSHNVRNNASQLLSELD